MRASRGSSFKPIVTPSRESPNSTCLMPVPCQHSLAMSSRTRKRLLIACVGLLVVPAVGLVVTFRGSALPLTAKVVRYQPESPEAVIEIVNRSAAGFDYSCEAQYPGNRRGFPRDGQIGPHETKQFSVTMHILHGPKPSSIRITCHKLKHRLIQELTGRLTEKTPVVILVDLPQPPENPPLP